MDMNDQIRKRKAVEAQLEVVTKELEACVWSITPAQAQAQIDQLNQQLAAMTQERDEAVRIATGLINWAPITDADVKWAEIALARHKHQEGLP